MLDGFSVILSAWRLRHHATYVAPCLLRRMACRNGPTSRRNISANLALCAIMAARKMAADDAMLDAKWLSDDVYGADKAAMCSLSKS